eukprot:Nk52_evm29s151 gene=Nk52_evmTU29s151
MSQLDRQYNHTHRLVLELQQVISDLHHGSGGYDQAASAAFGYSSSSSSSSRPGASTHRRGSGGAGGSAKEFLEEKIRTLEGEMEKLQFALNKEPMSRRMKSKLKVQQLGTDADGVRQSFQTFVARQEERAKEAAEREQLLSTRFQVNNSVASQQMMYAEGLAKENTSLTSSHREMDNLLGHGSSILEDLQQQRFTLKNAQKRLLDLTNTLGLSNTVMRFIEKRAGQDTWILWGGMVVTLVLMYLMWSYFRGGGDEFRVENLEELRADIQID